MGLLAEGFPLLRAAWPEGRMGLPAPLGRWVPSSVASGEVGGSLPELRGTICSLGAGSVCFLPSWDSAVCWVPLLQCQFGCLLHKPTNTQFFYQCSGVSWSANELHSSHKPLVHNPLRSLRTGGGGHSRTVQHHSGSPCPAWAIAQLPSLLFPVSRGRVWSGAPCWGAGWTRAPSPLPSAEREGEGEGCSEFSPTESLTWIKSLKAIGEWAPSWGGMCRVQPHQCGHGQGYFWECTLSAACPVGTCVHRSPLQPCVCCGLLTLAAEGTGGRGDKRAANPGALQML